MSLDPLRIVALARADWLERSRRPAFLVLLGVGLWAAWVFTPPNHSAYATFRIVESRGLYGSAWIGSTVTLLTVVFFSLVGFYVTKSAIAFDRRTGVGPVLASTPMRSVEYVLGKWLASTALLGSFTVVMMIGAGAMQFVRGEDPAFHPVALAAPFVLIAIPAMALTAALAVLFESIPMLRAGGGNLVYFFFWAMVLLRPDGATNTGSDPFDPLGHRVLMGRIIESVGPQVPGFAENPGSYSVGLNFRTGGWHLHTFAWEGIRWTPGFALSRLMWLLGAGVLAALAALPFDRFADEVRAKAGRRGKRRDPAGPGAESADAPAPAAAAIAPRAAGREGVLDLPPVVRGFAGIEHLLAELRLLLAGSSWLWWVSWIAVQLPGLLAPRDVAVRFAAVSWIWPVLRWSALGARDRLHGTVHLLDASPHPIGRQLPATLLAGSLLGLVAGAGFAIRSAIAGDPAAFAGAVVGALFVPALALALGTLTGGRKTFEIVYVVLWYAGPLSGGSIVDYTGGSPGAPIAGFAIATVVLAAVAAWARAGRIARG